MSNDLELITECIYTSKSDFNSVLSDKSINFEKEAAFAIQHFSNNEYSLQVALKNKQSVINSVTNLSAVGLSLNPAKKQAYLVPRKGAICLDIGFLGLLDLALLSGSIMWGQAKIVYENDNFELNRLDQLPTHKHNPFDKNRGEIIGVYVVVKTDKGDYLTHTMDIGSVFDIRDRSEAFKKNKSGPWATDPEEMIKKTCVKQAYKYWPKTDRLDRAINYLNTDGDEGIEFAKQAEEKLDIKPLIKAALETKTDAEALKFWKDNNGQLVKYPKEHAKLKEAVKNHRAKLKEKIVEPENNMQSAEEFVADIDAAENKP